MYKESLIFVAWAVAAANGLYLGFGGVSGNLTPRTGSSWPPYPGAGRGHWANRAGFYDGRASGFDYGRSRYYHNRRPKRSPLYAGFGGVVGELTPRTGGGYSGGSSGGGGRGSYSAYNRSRYARLCCIEIQVRSILDREQFLALYLARRSIFWVSPMQ